jgi:hypothetical protein
MVWSIPRALSCRSSRHTKTEAITGFATFRIVGDRKLDSLPTIGYLI